MKSERLFRALSDVGDDLIARAGAPVKKQPAVWLRWAGLAACCALVVGLAALALPQLGFGAKSAAQDAASIARSTVTQEAATEAASGSAQFKAEAAEAEESDEAPAEEPAEVMPAAPTDTTAPEPPSVANEEPAPGLPEPAEEPATVDRHDGAGGLLAAYACDEIGLTQGEARATVTDGAEIDRLLDEIACLPLEDGPEAASDAPTLTLTLYCDGVAYAVVTLPRFSVSAPEESAQRVYLSEASQALYGQLLARYFGE